MDQRPDLRASDQDRNAAVGRLRAAHDEGRLDLAEFDARVQRAYQAVTYGDIAKLFADLPAAGSAPVPAEIEVAPAQQLAIQAKGLVARMPVALKVLWTVWLSVVAINLTVWLLVGVSNGNPEYFWPMWFLVPGAALFGVTLGVDNIQRGRAARIAARARRRHIGTTDSS
jgi:hypothetical protein